MGLCVCVGESNVLSALNSRMVCVSLKIFLDRLRRMCFGCVLVMCLDPCVFVCENVCVCVSVMCVCVRERESGVCVSCVCELCVGVFGSEVVVVCMCVKFGCVYACCV